AAEAALRETCARIRGADAGATDALWERLYRDGYWRNDLIINSAISAIDQACWDLKGKKLGVPVHVLLGGKRRGRLRAYANAWYWGCETPAQFARAAAKVVADGYTAIKWDPFGDADLTMRGAAMRAAAADAAAGRGAARAGLRCGRPPRTGRRCGRRSGPTWTCASRCTAGWPRPGRSRWRAGWSRSTRTSTRSRSPSRTWTPWSRWRGPSASRWRRGSGSA